MIQDIAFMEFIVSARITSGKINGAGYQVRTGDPQLGKLMLYQLSYTRNRPDLARCLRGVNAIVVAMRENPANM